MNGWSMSMCHTLTMPSARGFGTTQMDAARLFASVRSEKCTTACSSGTTHSDRAVHRDVNTAQICGTFASPRTLRGRVEHPPFLTQPRRSGTAKSTTRICLLFIFFDALVRCHHPNLPPQPRRTTALHILCSGLAASENRI
jgi:hypothetical protein